MQNNSKTHLYLLPFVFFISIPLLIVNENIQDIAQLDILTIGFLAGLTIFSIGLLFTLDSKLGERQLPFLMGRGLELVLFFLIISGFVFPVSVSTGMIEPSEAPIALMNLLFVVVLTSVTFFLTAGKFRQPVYFGLTLFVLMNTALSGFAVASWMLDQQSRDQSLLYELSSERNVLVLSLDGLSGTAAGEVLAENKELARQFKGFTVFSRAAATSPATSASIATSLYGNRNYKSRYTTEKELWDSSPKDLLTNYLNVNEYQVSTFSWYGINFESKNRRFDSTLAGPVPVSTILNLTVARTLSSLLVVPAAWIDAFEIRLRFLLRPEDKNSFLLQVHSSKTPVWKKNLTPTIMDFDQYVHEIKPASPAPVAHFLHFGFTHFPVEFDRNCHYRADDSEWYDQHQNWEGVKEETYCAMLKFSGFISTLKATGVFERSLIVLKSDHGKPVIYYPGDSMFSKRIAGHDRWGYGRYEPFLAIKGFGDDNFPLKKDASPVLLDDLAVTLCTAALGIEKCGQYPGLNLLEKPLYAPDASEVTLYVVASERSDYKYDSHRAITVKRQPDILNNLYERLSDESEN